MKPEQGPSLFDAAAGPIPAEDPRAAAIAAFVAAEHAFRFRGDCVPEAGEEARAVLDAATKRCAALHCLSDAIGAAADLRAKALGLR